MAEIEIPQPDEMHEKAENPFTRTVALFVALYAVGLAFAAFGGNNTAKELFVLKQEEARTESAAKQDEFNTWNQFQAKAIREALYRNQGEMLESEAEAGTLTAARAKLQKKMAEQEARMKADKEELAAKAKSIREKGEHAVEHIRGELHTLQRKDPYFDFAEVAFQLAIVLASVAMLAGKKWAFALSLVLSIVALILTINGFFLFVPVPGLDPGPLAAAAGASHGH